VLRLNEGADIGTPIERCNCIQTTKAQQKKAAHEAPLSEILM
jgi:hypothetical protein